MGGKGIGDIYMIMTNYYDIPNQLVPIDDVIIQNYRDFFQCDEMYNIDKEKIDLKHLLLNDEELVKAVYNQFNTTENGKKIMSGARQTKQGLYYHNFQMRWEGNTKRANLIMCYYEGGYKAIIPGRDVFVEKETGFLFKRTEKQLKSIPNKPFYLTPSQSTQTLSYFENQYKKKILKTEYLRYIDFSQTSKQTHLIAPVLETNQPQNSTQQNSVIVVKKKVLK
jgi:hypothetical protein